MFPGLYTAASGMIAQGVQQDVLAANLSNIGVGAHRKQRVVFRSFPTTLQAAMANSGARGPTTGSLNNIGGGTGVDWIYTVFQQGNSRQTGVATDIALLGDGFFEVQSPAGAVAYTRNGAFHVGPDGFLRTQEGDFVLGESGPLLVGGELFRVDGEGNVAALPDGEAGEEVPVDRMRVVDFNNRDLLKPIAGARFVLEAMEPQRAFKQPERREVAQGYLESSNATPMGEMMHLMESFRNYETNSRVARAFDDTAARAIDLVLRRG